MALEQLCIAIDCPGGDDRIINGQLRSHDYDAVPAVCELSKEHPDVVFYLFGNKELIEGLKKQYDCGDNIKVENVPTVFPMDGNLREWLRRDTTISKALELHHEGKVDAVYTSGNSAAGVVCSRQICGLIDDLFNYSLVAHMPTGMNSKCYINDVGANKNPRPEDMLVNAILTQVFYKIMEKDSTLPKIGMFDNPFTEAALPYLKELSNFVGIVKPEDVYDGKVKIVVTDGFLGNIHINETQALVKAIWHKIKPEGKSYLYAGWNVVVNGILKPYFTPYNCCSSRTQFRTTETKPYMLAFGRTVDETVKDVIEVLNHLSMSSANIGVLSNGEEDIKGNQFSHDLRKELERRGMPCIGNVEPKECIKGKIIRNGIEKRIDVLATDTYTAQLKIQNAAIIEKRFIPFLRERLTPWNMVFRQKKLKELKEILDTSNYNGAPILGVNGYELIGHGSANRPAIKAGIKRTIILRKTEYVENEKLATQQIKEIINKVKQTSLKQSTA